MHGRRGLTLIELLVVVAIVALVAALLLPTVASVRQMAMNTVCASRLKELALACTLYHKDYYRYPSLAPSEDAGLTIPPVIDGRLPPLPAGMLTPQDINAGLLNDLGRYLNLPAITPDTPASDLPPAVQCPTVEDAETGRDEILLLRRPTPAFYTGYGYFGRLGEGVPQGLLVLLRPDRAAVPRNRGRAVLWADDLHLTLTDGAAWRYTHVNGRQRPGPMELSYEGPQGLAGQHRAYTDCSVEWVPASELKFEDNPTSLGIIQSGATLRIDQMYFCWF